MKRLLDRDISMAPTLWNAILLFYGFGKIHSKIACINMGIKRNKKLDEILQLELYALTYKMRKGNYLIGRDLDVFIYQKTKMLKDMRCYRAKRIKQTLPIKGRTRSNAKTSRKMSPWDNSFYAKRMNLILKKTKARLRKKEAFAMSNFYGSEEYSDADTDSTESEEEDYTESEETNADKNADESSAEANSESEGEVKENSNNTDTSSNEIESLTSIEIKTLDKSTNLTQPKINE